MGRIFLPTNQESNPLLDFGAVFSFLGDIWGIQINERFFCCSAPYFLYPYFGKCFLKINVENKVFPDKCERCGNYLDCCLLEGHDLQIGQTCTLVSNANLQFIINYSSLASL